VVGGAEGGEAVEGAEEEEELGAVEPEGEGGAQSARKKTEAGSRTRSNAH
jgi:hypothetical protein